MKKKTLYILLFVLALVLAVEALLSIWLIDNGCTEDLRIIKFISLFAVAGGTIALACYLLIRNKNGMGSKLRTLFSRKGKYREPYSAYAPSNDKIIITCPSCGAKLRVPNNGKAMKIKCAGCGNYFTHRM